MTLRFYRLREISTNFLSSMFSKRPATAFTINARDPVPDPPGHEMPRELRPPPKVYYPYRDCNGFSPKKIEKMMKRKREYEEECIKIQTESDIAKFEAKMNGTYIESEGSSVPVLPLPPCIDFDVIRSFEPPSATRFYDYVGPNIRPKTAPNKKKKSNIAHEKHMSHGCPCCNPNHFESIKTKTRTPTRNGRPIQRPTTATPRKKPNLPMQMNQAFCVLDEPSVPARPTNKYVEYPKPAHFSMLRTGPRPGGIPVCVNDLVASRETGENWFKNEMSKKKDRELFQREQTLHERSMLSRNFNLSLKEHTTEIAVDSQQKWAITGATGRLSSFEHKPKNKQKTLSKDELEALDELTRYDEKLYQDYQAKKRPTDEMELLLQQSGMRKFT